MSKLQSVQIAPRWNDPRQVEVRLVPDPSMTDAEYFHQRQTKAGDNVGKTGAAISMIELIGGLARIKDRTEPQEAAAAKFRMLFDRSQIGGAKATDYTKQRVDTSGPQQDASAEYGDDARRQYRDAVQFLGLLQSSLVERVVVHDQAISTVAGKSSRARTRVTRELLDALDRLAVHFGLSSTKPK
ncbi:hypothetical protein [Devosia aurantiaca]|uniref:Uncharacterized protein n=1 Tax=Devosia aurantiaca TaxID=2714858 RepID=A0A6M1SUU8_9HYPH|nr:hypothetical protein [Devosia aurantiaca]NGP18895.1 hypothetical protein [Devosia aurantiaca]